jgi:UDP-N-acetylmuramate dehydrogenase
MATIADTFERLQRHVAGETTRDEPLATRTSVRVGGAADLFVQPKDELALVQALAILEDAAQPWVILGGGANTLVGDGGVRGAVIKLPSASSVVVPDAEGITATLGGGQAIAKLLSVQREYKAVGAEYMAGIPGTIGGAVAMNAGTKNGWVQYVLESVRLATADGLTTVPSSELLFAYRHTRLPPRSVVWEATFRLRFGDVEASEKKISEDLAYRRSTQPLHLPNSGSVFINPPKLSSGKLIEEAGLKGLREGNAQISEMHANFIVNRGGAKAREIVFLMEKAKKEVFERTGVELKAEVKRVGEP